MQTAPPRLRHDIVVIGLPGSLLGSIGTVLDGFAQVARQIQKSFAPPYGLSMESKVRLFATSGDLIELSGGRTLAADGNLLTRGHFQAIFVAAFQASNESLLLSMLQDQAALGQWLRAKHAAGGVIAASGTAVCMLAEAGLLDKGSAVVPDEWTALFRRRYPRIRHETKSNVAEHQRVLTAGSAADEWPLVVRLVEYATSPITARALAATVGLSRSRGDALGMAEDPIVAAAQFWLGERFARPFNITDMARDLAISHSTLLRRFYRSLAVTPRRYALVLRMESAKSMLVKTNRSIDQISAMLGYTDTRSFRTAFRGLTRASPTEYRLRMAK